MARDNITKLLDQVRSLQVLAWRTSQAEAARADEVAAMEAYYAGHGCRPFLAAGANSEDLKEQFYDAIEELERLVMRATDDVWTLEAKLRDTREQHEYYENQ